MKELKVIFALLSNGKYNDQQNGTKTIDQCHMTIHISATLHEQNLQFDIENKLNFYNYSRNNKYLFLNIFEAYHWRWHTISNSINRCR